MRTSQGSQASRPEQRAGFGDRTFTGDANIRPGVNMGSLPPNSDSQHLCSTNLPVKQPVDMQPAFTMGSGAATLSPSKKRAHKDLKFKQTAASASSSPPPRANPFAPYGVATNANSSQANRRPAKGSPVKASTGASPPRPFKVLLKPDRPQGMNIDSGSSSPSTACFTGMSPRPTASTASSVADHTPNQPGHTQPFATATASTGMLFPQPTAAASCRLSVAQDTLPPGGHTAFTFKPSASTAASSHPSSQATANPFSFKPAATTDASRPSAAAPKSTSRYHDAAPASQAAAAAAAAAAATAAAAAATPPSFSFRSRQVPATNTPSAQTPFQGFGNASVVQDAPDTPGVRFPGFQPGVQSEHGAACSST